MSIDWDATGSMLQGWGSLIGAGAVIYAAKKGAVTFDSWKRQKVAERKRDQAEEVLAATYQARRALRSVRSPGMWGHEYSRAEEQLKESDHQWAGESEAKQKRLVTFQAYLNRLKHTQPQQQRLEDTLPMARALFGAELEQAIKSLLHQFWIVQVDVESYVDDDGQDAEFTRNIRYTMYDIKPRDGEVSNVSDAIAKAVETIEGVCLPAMALT
jgi:hypothetical protein